MGSPPLRLCAAVSSCPVSAASSILPGFPGFNGVTAARGRPQADLRRADVRPIASFGESAYAFAADFPEAGSDLPIPVLGGVLSSGMTTDAQGNFFLAGFNQVCGGDTNALINLSAGLTGGRCLPSVGGLFGSGLDVAVSPTAPVACTTMGQGVLAWSFGGATAARSWPLTPPLPHQ